MNSHVSQQDAAKELIRRRRAREYFLDFTEYTFPIFEYNWHHGVIADKLNRFVRGEIKRLMLFMPPRHTKSEFVSRRLPAYILGRNPDARIIATSYSADLASAMNRDVQRIIDSDEYQRLFPNTQLFSANIRTVAKGTYLRNSDVFEIVGHRGIYRSAGVGGGITGMGFDYGIIDDPIKNREEANSETYREKTWDWYRSVFYTRQEKNASILVTLTRWHADDLAGRILRASEEETGEKWEVISLPAIAVAPIADYDQREAGTALWENKFNREALDRIHATIGEYDWTALYQQQPTLGDGGLFKRPKFNLIDHAPADIVKTARFWDLALSEKTSADYTVGLLMGITKSGRIVILDVKRFQADWDDLKPRIKAVMLEDGIRVPVGIESAFFHSQLVKKMATDPALHAYSVRGYAPDKDKFTRALPFAARVGEQLVDVLKRSWTDNLLDELCSFPLGANDDMVDAASGAYFMLDGRQPIQATAQSYTGNQ